MRQGICISVVKELHYSPSFGATGCFKLLPSLFLFLPLSVHVLCFSCFRATGHRVRAKRAPPIFGVMPTLLAFRRYVIKRIVSC